LTWIQPSIVMLELSLWNVGWTPFAFVEFVNQRDELRGRFSLAHGWLEFDLLRRLHCRFGKPMAQRLDWKNIFDRAVGCQHQPQADFAFRFLGARLVRVFSRRRINDPRRLLHLARSENLPLVGTGNRLSVEPQRLKPLAPVLRIRRIQPEYLFDCMRRGEEALGQI